MDVSNKLAVLNSFLEADKTELFSEENHPTVNILFRMKGFYLTGSRYFSPESVDSDSTDWDFFCEDSTSNRRILDSLGFRETTDLHRKIYRDIDLRGLYEMEVEEVARVNIDVQIVENIQGRLLIRKILKELNLPWKSFDKEKVSQLWDTMYQLLVLPSPLGISKEELQEKYESNKYLFRD